MYRKSPYIDPYEFLPLGARIEKLKKECEEGLGEELFMQLYRYYQEHADDRSTPSFVPDNKRMYVRKVLKILQYERELYK